MTTADDSQRLRQQARPWLAAYAEEALPAAGMAWMAEQLAADPLLRQELADVQGWQQRLRQQLPAAAPYHLDAGRRAALFKRAAALRPSLNGPQQRWWWNWKSLAASILAAFFVFIGISSSLTSARIAIRSSEQSLDWAGNDGGADYAPPPQVQDHYRADPPTAARRDALARAPAPEEVNRLLAEVDILIDADVEVERPVVHQLEVRVEEMATEDSEVVVARGREEALASSETGGSGAFMALGSAPAARTQTRTGGGRRRAAPSAPGLVGDQETAALDSLARDLQAASPQAGRPAGIAFNPIREDPALSSALPEPIRRQEGQQGQDWHYAQGLVDDPQLLNHLLQSRVSTPSVAWQSAWRPSPRQPSLGGLQLEGLRRGLQLLFPAGLQDGPQFFDEALPLGRAVIALSRQHRLQVDLWPDGAETVPEAAPRDPLLLPAMDRDLLRHAFAITPFQDIAEAAQQTFALEVSTASFQQALLAMQRQQRINPLSIRAEHFVNAMPQQWPEQHGQEAFTLFAEAMPSQILHGPRAAQTLHLALGVIARPLAADERQPLHLTLCLDASGSMAAGAWESLRGQLDLLIAELQEGDSVAIVTFADQASVLLPATPVSERERIQQHLDAVLSQGLTDAREGLQLAWQLAREAAVPGAQSRVVLASDGSSISPEGMQQLLATIAADRGRVDLSICAVQADAAASQRLQRLADAAQSELLHLEQANLAEHLLPERLQTLARDARAQVNWNPQRVSHARLIGFEERRLRAEEFRDDRTEAGNLVHESRMTALFEVILHPEGSGPLGSAAVRYYDTRYQSMRELEHDLPAELLQQRGSEGLLLMTVAAAVADILAVNWWDNVHLYERGALPEQLRALLRSRDPAIRQAARQLQDLLHYHRQSPAVEKQP